MDVKKVRKAIAGGVSAGLAAALAAYPDGFTDQELLTVAFAVLAGGFAVWRTPNKRVAPVVGPRPGGDAGEADVGLILLILIGIGVLLLCLGVVPR